MAGKMALGGVLAGFKTCGVQDGPSGTVWSTCGVCKTRLAGVLHCWVFANIGESFAVGLGILSSDHAALCVVGYLVALLSQ